MNLITEMLLAELPRLPNAFSPYRVRPKFTVRAGLLPGFNKIAGINIVDRLVNRYWDYRRAIEKLSDKFDVFHIVDHSYGHLAQYLPAERTIITCHDLDAFAPLFQESRDLTSAMLKPLLKETLQGLQRASIVTCPSSAVRTELLNRKFLNPDRVRVVQNGVHPSCSPDPDPDGDIELAKLIGDRLPGTFDLIHVGSTIPRKRIDVLLRVVAALVQSNCKVRLFRIGGAFTREQEDLARKLKLLDFVVRLPSLSWRLLACAYRRADLYLQSSEAEGFGLPVAEAMACGTPVAASNLEVLREVGGEGAVYCGVGDIEDWTVKVKELLEEREYYPQKWAARKKRVIQDAAKFSWATYAQKMSALYEELLTQETSDIPPRQLT
jgi:glycosyltransferase involved in cell wall biosynthesis